MHSELSDLPLEFEFRGKTYYCSLIDDDLETKYERQEFAKALENLEVLKPTWIDPDKYDRELRRLRKHYRDGAYRLKTLFAKLEQDPDKEAAKRKATEEVLPLMIRDEDGRPISKRVLRDMVVTIPEILVNVFVESANLSFMPMKEENDRKKKQILQQVRAWRTRRGRSFRTQCPRPPRLGKGLSGPGAWPVAA